MIKRILAKCRRLKAVKLSELLYGNLRRQYYKIPIVRKRKIKAIIKLMEKWISESKLFSISTIGKTSEMYKHRAELLEKSLNNWKKNLSKSDSKFTV